LETAVALDAVIVAALQGENRFEVVPFPRQEVQRRYHRVELSSASALPHGLLGQLREDLAVDAVLFVDLTVFSAYRPLRIGLRAKLAATEGSRLIWSFDDTFAADDPAVANSARRHVLTGDRSAVPVDLSPGVLQSPARFAEYAAATMFSTLPPVIARPVAGKVATTR
jgi:hypothetical protein